MFVKIVTAYLNHFLHVNKSNTLKSESFVLFNYVLNYYPNRLILFDFDDIVNKYTNACKINLLSGKKQCAVKPNLSRPVWGKKKELFFRKTLMPPYNITHSYTYTEQRAHCLADINLEH